MKEAAEDEPFDGLVQDRDHAIIDGQCFSRT